MARTSNGSGLDASFNGSPTTPRREGKDREKQHFVKHHDKYYMVGGDLFVLIDDVMFKIHSYFFQREARNFFDDAPAPSGPLAPTSKEGDEGKSEGKAVRILDVTVEEFEQFLWVFYNPRYSIYDAPIASWFSILKLAHRWDFPVVKDFALRELKRREREVPLVKRIRLYHDYEAPPECLVPLYGELCARDLTPTEGEAVELGFEKMYRVFKARELLRSPVDAGADGPLSPLPKGMVETETYPTIQEVFGLPAYSPAEGSDSNEGGESRPQPEGVDKSQAKDGVPTLKAPQDKKKQDKPTKHQKN